MPIQYAKKIERQKEKPNFSDMKKCYFSHREVVIFASDKNKEIQKKKHLTIAEPDRAASSHPPVGNSQSYLPCALNTRACVNTARTAASFPRVCDAKPRKKRIRSLARCSLHG